MNNSENGKIIDILNNRKKRYEEQYESINNLPKEWFETEEGREAFIGHVRDLIKSTDDLINGLKNDKEVVHES